MRLLPWVVLLACLSGCPKAKCDVSTCASGCCDASGTCQTGDSATACGTGAALCTSCVPSSCSALRVCTPSGSGGGGGASGGGAGGGTGGGGGATGARTVTFSRTITYVDERGTQAVSELGDAGISLFIVDGGVMSAIPGARVGSTWVAQNVPAGEYLIRYGNAFYVARADTLDLGSTDLGRPDQQYVDAGAATFTLASAGLPAWGDLDSMILFSHGGNLYGWDPDSLTSGPTAGLVPSAFTWDYGALTGGDAASRLEAAKGDTLWAMYLQGQPLITTPVPGAADDGGVADVPFQCNVSAAVAHLTSVTINAGPNAAAATFTTTPTQSIAVTLPRTQWAARTAEVHPQAVLTGESLYVIAEPATGTASADLISCFNDPRFENPVSDINRSVTVVNPLPSSWKLLGVMETFFRVSVTVPDAGTWSSAGSTYVAADVNQPLVPQVHAPVQLTVQSIAADQLVTAAAAGPLTVSWGPSPGTPAATDYLVSVLRMTKPAGLITRNTIVSALTRGTSFTFPPGTLTLGEIYQVRVRASVRASSEAAPFLSRLQSSSDAVTNPFLAQ